MMMVINPSIEIYLVGPDGAIRAYSAPRDKIKRTQIDVAPIRQFLNGKERIPILGEDPRDPTGKKVFAATRIPEKGKLEGYLYVILGGEAYDTVAQKLKASYILRLSGWMIGASLLFALIAGLIIFALLTHRLKRISLAVSEYDVNNPIKLTGLFPDKIDGKGDEIDRLIITFKSMAAHIQDQMNELKDANNLRREMIANVSHDLKTPLSTLQGYMETLLLKDKDFTEDERKAYLETAINHCHRLGKLINELLELAKLESDQIQLQMELFNLNELVQDVVMKFQLKADEKQIKLVPVLNQALPFVEGDIGLIERVFENLMENAIRYTPENGTVEIRLQAGPNRIAVHISDTGSGIPEDELSHIFKRFYRIDHDGEKQTGHSGLGLAITRKILELHHSNIQVQSRLNLGTTITFHLSAVARVS
jgi:signal transduction histidine kinase